MQVFEDCELYTHFKLTGMAVSVLARTSASVRRSGKGVIAPSVSISNKVCFPSPPQSSPARCPRGCRNGGRCIAPGKCRCGRGFSGSTCRVARTTNRQPELASAEKVCSPQCGNGGKCRKSGRCKCPPGFSGPACQTKGERKRRRRGRKMGERKGKKESKRRKNKRTNKARNLIQHYLQQSASHPR